MVAWVGNDVLVPALWMHQLAGLLAMDARIGAVGPMSNLAGEQQRVSEVPYRIQRPSAGGESSDVGLDISPVDDFARQWREANKGQWKQVERVGGFCWLARREAVATAFSLSDVGVVSEAELSAGIRKAGFQIACCRDLIVYHFGKHLR